MVQDKNPWINISETSLGKFGVISIWFIFHLFPMLSVEVSIFNWQTFFLSTSSAYAGSPRGESVIPKGTGAYLNHEAKLMSPQKIEQEIIEKNWHILEQQESFSPNAAQSIVPLLEHRDEEVRELAVHSLSRAEGPEARKGLLKALNDPDDMVRAAAARFIRSFLTASELPDLLNAISTNEDEYVREQAALTVGEIEQKSAIEALKSSFYEEKDSHARKAMSLALAKLGELQHRNAYLLRLREDNPQERTAALHDFVYLNDQNLVPEVIPLLDDKRDAENVGPSHGPYWIRVCDVAINKLDILLNHPFPFLIDRAKRYIDEEIQQTKNILGNL